MSETSPKPRRAKRDKPGPVPVVVVGGEVSTLGSAEPFWFKLPAVAMGCLAVFMFPFRAVLVMAEIALASALLAIGGMGWMWWTKRITDQDVAGVLMEGGDRILGILRGAGVF